MKHKNRHPLIICLILSAVLLSILGGRGRYGAYAAYDYKYEDAPLLTLPLRGFSEGITPVDVLTYEPPARERIPFVHPPLFPPAPLQEVTPDDAQAQAEGTPPAPAENDTLPAGEGEGTPQPESPAPQQDPPAPQQDGTVPDPGTGTEGAAPLPEASGAPADDSYYADALFIGDSRTVGLSQYVPALDAQATFFCKTSLSIFGALNTSVPTPDGNLTIDAALQLRQYGKIYIMLGINEIGYGIDQFVEQYRQVLARIRELQPDAVIYIQSIMHVSANKQAAQPVFSNASVNERNARLSELANGTDIIYIDINYPLDDASGSLNGELTFDGVHLTAGAYSLWYDAIKAQTR